MSLHWPYLVKRKEYISLINECTGVTTGVRQTRECRKNAIFHAATSKTTAQPGRHDYVISRDRLMLASHKQSASRSTPQDDTSGTPTIKGNSKEDAADQ